jgi:hypothetical protein
MPQDHLPQGFNDNVEPLFERDHDETLAICGSLARAAFKEAIAEHEVAPLTGLKQTFAPRMRSSYSVSLGLVRNATLKGIHCMKFDA